MTWTAAGRAASQGRDEGVPESHVVRLGPWPDTIPVWRLPAHGARRANFEEVKLRHKVGHFVVEEGLLEDPLVVLALDPEEWLQHAEFGEAPQDHGHIPRAANVEAIGVIVILSACVQSSAGVVNGKHLGDDNIRRLVEVEVRARRYNHVKLMRRQRCEVPRDSVLAIHLVHCTL